MATWRCPHCGTPQAEAARCWVCRRSSTVCSTCRHVRRAVAGGLAYCGRDPRRAPLRGDEIRPCWEGRPIALTVDLATRGARPDRTNAADQSVGRTQFGSRRGGFVFVESADAAVPSETAIGGPASSPAAAIGPAAIGDGAPADLRGPASGARITTLWADLDG